MGCSASSEAADRDTRQDAPPLGENPLRLTPLIGPGAERAPADALAASTEDSDRHRRWAQATVREQVRALRYERREARRASAGRRRRESQRDHGSGHRTTQDEQGHAPGRESSIADFHAFVCFESRRVSEAVADGGASSVRLESSRRGADLYGSFNDRDVAAAAAADAESQAAQLLARDIGQPEGLDERTGAQHDSSLSSPDQHTMLRASSPYLPRASLEESTTRDMSRTLTGHRFAASDSFGPRSSGPATPVRIGSMIRFHHHQHHAVVAGLPPADATPEAPPLPAAATAVTR